MAWVYYGPTSTQHNQCTPCKGDQANRGGSTLPTRQDQKSPTQIVSLMFVHGTRCIRYRVNMAIFLDLGEYCTQSYRVSISLKNELTSRAKFGIGQNRSSCQNFLQSSEGSVASLRSNTKFLRVRAWKGFPMKAKLGTNLR